MFVYHHPLIIYTESMLLKTNKILLHIINLSTKIFIAFFIWQTKQDVSLFLFYTLALFISAPFGSIIASILGIKIEPKYGILVGNWIQIIQITFLLFFVATLNIPIAIVLGLFGGFAESNKSSTMRMLEILKNESGKENIEHFYAKKALTYNVLKGIIPLSIVYLISKSGSYDALFAIVIVLLVVSSLLSLTINTTTTKPSFELKEILKIPGTNPNKLLLIITLFFEGITEGITTTILPIIILVYVGGIVNWGWINTGVVVFTILVTAIMSKKLNDSTSRGAYSIGALLFATTSIFFIIHFNIIVIGAFLLAMAFMDVIKSTSFNSSIERITNSDRSEKELTPEYLFLIETSLSIGRILPIIIILITVADINKESFIRILFLITGFLPLLTMSFLSKTTVFTNDPGIEDIIKKSERISVPSPTNY